MLPLGNRQNLAKSVLWHYFKVLTEPFKQKHTRSSLNSINFFSKYMKVNERNVFNPIQFYTVEAVQ